MFHSEERRRNKTDLGQQYRQFFLPLSFSTSVHNTLLDIDSSTICLIYVENVFVSFTYCRVSVYVYISISLLFGFIGFCADDDDDDDDKTCDHMSTTYRPLSHTADVTKYMRRVNVCEWEQFERHHTSQYLFYAPVNVCLLPMPATTTKDRKRVCATHMYQ